ncbi:MAG: hypothetical protein ACK47B_02700 [Armatimonadota bacterium]
MSADNNDRYVIKLDSGEFYQGKDENGELKWTRVPSWAHQLDDPAELGQILEYLEKSEHDYSLMAVR